MWPVAVDCVRVCLWDTLVSPAKTAEPIGGAILGGTLEPKKPLLYGGPIPPRERDSLGKCGLMLLVIFSSDGHFVTLILSHKNN